MAKDTVLFQNVLAQMGSNLIETVDLSNQALTLQDMKDLANALRTNISVQELELGGNAIDDAGITALANALGENTTLLHLFLRNNGSTMISQAIDTLIFTFV